jgi:catechol 2,3-dioxygenase-like lactoylglutathione lyase family enzyme
MVISSFPDLCVRDVRASVEFYRALLDLDVVVDHGWYAELGAGGPTLIALVQRGHETVPASIGAPAGVLLSFVVDDVEAIASRVALLDCPIVWPLTTELGQRHVMVADRDGAIVDVIQHVPLTAADRRRLVQLRRQHADPQR